MHGKEQTLVAETARIKEIYEKDVNNIDNVYVTLEDNSKKYLKDVVSIGDYVAYNVTEGVEDKTKLTYESKVGTGMSHGNGHSTQTFTANSNIKWRVLNVNYTSGEVTLISETPLQTDAGQAFYLSGAIGYLYAEQELNEICKIYGYGKGANTAKTFEYETGDEVEGLDKGTIIGSGARSINVDDINKITGYAPQEGVVSTATVFYPTKLTESGWSTLEMSRTMEDTSYIYIASDYLNNITNKEYKILFMDIENSNYINYWMSSRCVSIDTNAEYFHIRVVGEGKIEMDWLARYRNETKTDRNASFSIRPIVYLKTNLRTTGKDANGAWMISEE